MKKIFLLQAFIILAAGILSSCNFLNVDEYFDDTFKQDQIFTSKINIERYFNGAVNLLPREGRIYYWCTVPGATGSDEAISCGTFNNGFLEVTFPGSLITTDKITTTEMGGWQWDFNVWPTCYKIIRKINTILPRINDVPDMNTFEKSDLRAQARFLRAYAYYWILQNQGPMIIVGEKLFDTNEQPEYYLAERSTYDECVDYICSEFETAAEGLATVQPIDLWGRPTKGAALALVARLRLQAASPLYNGGSAAKKYFGAFLRKSDGAHYVSQTYDDKKWAIAAAAAKRVMDMNVYTLYTVPSDESTAALPSNVPSANFPLGAGGIDPFRSYSEMFTGEATKTLNNEIIWGTTKEPIGDQMDAIFPIGLGGYSGVSIPQRIIDSYYMVDGRSINNSSIDYPYVNRPYDNTCIVQGDKKLSKNYTLKAGTYKAFENREPRFYASIGFSGCHWTLESTSQSDLKNKIVNYHYGALYGKTSTSTNVYNLTGYVCKKYVHPRDARNGSGSRVIEKAFPIIRYAEILLSYAEALNNIQGSHTINGESFSRNTESIKSAFDMIRYRAGLPGATEGELSTSASFNNVIQRECMIELLHENRRYYDIRRWGIIEELESQPLTGLNVEATEWNGFYAPTIISHKMIRERVFKPKMILMPLHKNELRKVPTLVQNPGWEN